MRPTVAEWFQDSEKGIYLSHIFPLTGTRDRALVEKSWFSIKKLELRVHSNSNLTTVPAAVINHLQSSMPASPSLTVHKNKLYLTSEQRRLINKLFGMRRYMYNRCVAYYNTK